MFPSSIGNIQGVSWEQINFKLLINFAPHKIQMGVENDCLETK